MKRILNIIGIFFLSIIVFTGCQNFTEDEMEMSPQTRAQLSSGTHYYWYKGNKIPITINTTKSYILFESSDEANLQLPLLNSKSGLSAAKVTLSSRLQLQDATRSAANDNLYWAEVATADVNAQDKALVYSAPYFKTSDGADLGLSHLFYVKVKSIRDVRILTTLATENKVTLLGNNEYSLKGFRLICFWFGASLKFLNLFLVEHFSCNCYPFSVIASLNDLLSRSINNVLCLCSQFSGFSFLLLIKRVHNLNHCLKTLLVCFFFLNRFYFFIVAVIGQVASKNKHANANCDSNLYTAHFAH